MDGYFSSVDEPIDADKQKEGLIDIIYRPRGTEVVCLLLFCCWS